MTEMLARIRQRSQRPIVKRDRSLAGQDAPATEKEAASSPEPEAASLLDEQLGNLPEVAARRNVRLEKSIDCAVRQFCDRAGITLETFLEAAYLACEQDADLRQSILKEAEYRLLQRKQAGKLRRLHSQLKNLGNS